MIKPDILKYLAVISDYFKDENSSEMSYRTPFENLLKEIFPVEEGYKTQHDQRSIAGNKPDFIVTKNEVPILYIEVKKVGEDLDKIEKSQQASRYFGYDNLIISDYLSFRFYRNGIKYDESISLGTANVKTKLISLHTEQEERLIRTIRDFTISHKERIKSGKHLAKIMGGKAQRIRDNVVAFLESEKADNEDLKKIMSVVKENLIADITNSQFADMYAQTLVYGLFAARYNDKTHNNFSRQEARELVPATNPFLQHFFDHIAGVSFPKRLDTIVTELCEVFSHADVKELMHDYFKKSDLWGKEYESPDPVIHFYEDFLQEYDPSKKMEMGVFYTPLPIVRFIVRAVDSLLKEEFGISKGLTDDSKISFDKDELDHKGKKIIVQKEYSKVQILDVATGTGTFLNEVIQHIYKDFKGQEGRWPAYVKDSLIPRLNGFELMMASYTIAHLKLGMTFQETGVDDLNERIRVFLTNSLEESKFSSWDEKSLFVGIQESITRESIEASKVKSEYPIMCIMGNPPYAVSSNNKGKWIQDKIEDYKKDLNEKKINIDDDYIKFIRLGQHMIDKNGEGILAYISNNSFISGVTHRKMRESLLKSFTSIYILDLHGNARTGESGQDNGKDQNVFDIMQGVSINIFVKNKEKTLESELANVYHYDLYGSRKYKYLFLNENNLNKIHWKELQYSEPYYFFIPKDFSAIKEYEKGFKVNEIITEYNSGIQTKNDEFTVSLNKKTLEDKIEKIKNSSLEDVKKSFVKEGTWSIDRAYEDIKDENVSIEKYQYKYLDTRYITYSPKNKILGRSRSKTSQHILTGKNFSLVLMRGTVKSDILSTVAITDNLVDINFYGFQSYFFPLYLYINEFEKIPNLNKEIWENINIVVGKTDPEDILDYMYAYLHSPNYREKYKDFLKIDFPRIPYPETKEEFWNLVLLGTKLRELHLLTDPILINPPVTFPIVGSKEIEKISYKNGNVYINETQYFGEVPEVAWNFYVGGYQPAQKWLKDRKGKILSNNDIEHYQKIIISIIETDKVMKEIDSILIN